MDYRKYFESFPYSFLSGLGGAVGGFWSSQLPYPEIFDQQRQSNPFEQKSFLRTYLLGSDISNCNYSSNARFFEGCENFIREIERRTTEKIEL